MFRLTLFGLSWDVLSALGRSVDHSLSCQSRPVRSELGCPPEAVQARFSLRLLVRSGCFPICVGMSGLQLSDLALPDQSWNVWSETMVVQAELD